MARLARLDIPLASEQRAELDALAEASGVSATALGRLGIVQLLARQELIMGGETGSRSDLDAFVAALRAANPKLADDLARALAGLDGVTPKKVEILKAVEAIERFFENARQVGGSGFDVAG
jgi:hypothetical protein